MTDITTPILIRASVPAAITLLHTMKGHTSEILSLAWSPDGKRLASGSIDRTVCLWDGHSGGFMYSPMIHPSWGSSVAWSPDGVCLVSWAADVVPHLWDSSTMTLLHTLDEKEHLDYIQSVAWSPDGTRLTSRSVDGAVYLWDASTGKFICALEGDMGDVSWSPDGKWLASCSADKTVRVWDGSSGKFLRILLKHTNTWSLMWSPDGTQLASCSPDKMIRLWNSGSGKLLHTLKGHIRSISSLTWSPDGTRLVSATYSSQNDTELCIWHTSTGQLLAMFLVSRGWASLAWHPHLPLFATSAQSSGDICLWQLDIPSNIA